MEKLTRIKRLNGYEFDQLIEEGKFHKYIFETQQKVIDNLFIILKDKKDLKMYLKSYSKSFLFISNTKDWKFYRNLINSYFELVHEYLDEQDGVQEVICKKCTRNFTIDKHEIKEKNIKNLLDVICYFCELDHGNCNECQI